MWGLPGVLIECDPSIKSIIVNIDSDRHEFIIEDLDEERVVVKENMVAALKQKLEEVRFPSAQGTLPLLLLSVPCVTDSFVLRAAPEGESSTRRRVRFRVRTAITVRLQPWNNLGIFSY
jgi:TFIIH basal transcription factor complex TTD-A subunit